MASLFLNTCFEACWSFSFVKEAAFTPAFSGYEHIKNIMTRDLAIHMSKHGPVRQPQERRDSWMDWLPEYLSFVSYLWNPKSYLGSAETFMKLQQILRTFIQTMGFLLLQLQSWECPTSYAMRRYPHSYIAHPSEAACRTQGHFERNGFLTFPLSVHNIQHVFIEIQGTLGILYPTLI